MGERKRDRREEVTVSEVYDFSDIWRERFDTLSKSFCCIFDFFGSVVGEVDGGVIVEGVSLFHL